MLVATEKQVQTGQRVTVPARVEDQATRFRVRPVKEPSAASLDPLALFVRSGHEISGAAGCWLPRQSRRRLPLPA